MAGHISRSSPVVVLGNFDKAVTKVSATESRRNWEYPSGRESFQLSNSAGLQMADSQMQKIEVTLTHSETSVWMVA
jgi:hypothetical protein